MWDAMAEDFKQAPIPDANSSFTMRLIEEHKMCPLGGRVLDIGCGTGKYAIALARTGAGVVATDFSQKMLDAARQCAAKNDVFGIAFSRDDWTHVGIREKRWEKAFDLVLCCMTPAVCDEDTLKKAADACKGWLLITKPCRRSSSVLDRLKEIVELDPAGDAADRHIRLAFSLLWDMGCLPQVAYEQQVWNSQRPLEQAVSYYTGRLESSSPLSGEQREALRDYLTGISDEGVVREETRTVVTAVYCSLQNS